MPRGSQLLSPAQSSHLTRFSGKLYRGEQGCKPHSTYHRIGGIFRSAILDEIELWTRDFDTAPPGQEHCETRQLAPFYDV